MTGAEVVVERVLDDGDRSEMTIAEALVWLHGHGYAEDVAIAEAFLRDGGTIRTMSSSWRIVQTADGCPACGRDIDRLGGNPDCEVCAAEPAADDGYDAAQVADIAERHAAYHGVVVETILPGTPEWDESEIALEAQRKRGG